MALFKMRPTGKTLITIIIAVAVLAVGIPLVSAYEAHAINVTVHVENRPYETLFKTMRLATGNETSGEIGEFLALVEAMDPEPVNFPPGTPNVGVTDPANVPVDTFILWLVTIVVTNTENYPWTDVVVKDNFSAELGGQPYGTDVVDLFIKTHSKGKSKKEIFETQYRITWYVTCLDSPGPGECVDNGGELGEGESAYLELYVWTKLNPAGHQEYTSTGTYTMNSGPNVKWFDSEGQQFSFDGEPLYITVYP